MYNFVTGLAYLPASIIAGVLWALHPTYAFLFSTLITFIALCVFLILKSKIINEKNTM
jgi:VIT1/CCC1 family predicted Fe2+/Mn2+ transporter